MAYRQRNISYDTVLLLYPNATRHTSERFLNQLFYREPLNTYRRRSRSDNLQVLCSRQTPYVYSIRPNIHPPSSNIRLPQLNSHMNAIVSQSDQFHLLPQGQSILCFNFSLSLALVKEFSIHPACPIVDIAPCININTQWNKLIWGWPWENLIACTF